MGAKLSPITYFVGFLYPTNESETLFKKTNITQFWLGERVYGGQRKYNTQFVGAPYIFHMKVVLQNSRPLSSRGIYISA